MAYVMQGYDELLPNVTKSIQSTTASGKFRKFGLAASPVVVNMTLGRLSPFLNRVRRHGPFIKQTSFIFFNFITWIPALVFFNSNVGEVAWVYGGSMYPYLNTDIDRSTRQDACWNNKWKPLQGLRRGMIVTFWFVTFEISKHNSDHPRLILMAVWQEPFTPGGSGRQARHCP
jgi:hypothetical protein